MEVFAPYQMTPEESRAHSEDFNQRAKDMKVSNVALVEYIRAYFESYRRTVEEFFPTFAAFVPFFAAYPFKTSIVRLGPNGIIIGHCPDKSPDVQVMDVADIQPPLESVNIVDIIARLNAAFCTFDFSIRSYDRSEAELCGARDALNALLEHFWSMLVPNEQAFEELCQQLLVAEGVALETRSASAPDSGLDAIGIVFLNEPGGFRRREKWGFQFKLYRMARLAAKDLRQAEHYLGQRETALDVLCLLTSDDLTSIGHSIVIQNPQLRVWDRGVLNILANKHPGVFGLISDNYISRLTTIRFPVARTIIDAGVK